MEIALLYFSLVAVRPEISIQLTADACGTSRKVTCGTTCAAGETADTTQKCVYSREQYKLDGIGCVRYVPECWCKLSCPPMPPVLKL